MTLNLRKKEVFLTKKVKKNAWWRYGIACDLQFFSVWNCVSVCFKWHWKNSRIVKNFRGFSGAIWSVQNFHLLIKTMKFINFAFGTILDQQQFYSRGILKLLPIWCFFQRFKRISFLARKTDGISKPVDVLIFGCYQMFTLKMDIYNILWHSIYLQWNDHSDFETFIDTPKYISSVFKITLRDTYLKLQRDSDKKLRGHFSNL